MSDFFNKDRQLPFEQALWLSLWLVIGAVIALFASLPISTWAQAILGVFGVVIVVMLRPFAAQMVPRFILLSIASAMVLRYWIWRLTETLPSWEAPISLVAAILLFAVETYAIAIFFLTSFMTADPLEQEPPPTVRISELPTVDILVPSYNEPKGMLAVTLAAAMNMHYPPEKRRVVLCDDGGTDQRMAHEDPKVAEGAAKRRAELQRLCADLGVIYSTREFNEHAKAGNMSAALERLDGDLVAVFDADHVPSRDFLARTAGYFVEQDDLFLVQTPHFFLNSDPIHRNIGLEDNCPPENEMFYGHTHMGLDRWHGTFFCGSAALIRRQALDSVGGFSGETITEDAETALDIHATGWKSLYVNRAMIAGLQPETFTSFIEQRGRWAAGMMQMLLLKNPLLRKGLKVTQRLCYINSMTFWFFPVVRMVFLLAPLLYLFFGLEIFVATYAEVIAYMATYVAVSFIVQNALFNRVRWPLISELYETTQAPFLTRAILRTFLNPRGAKFNVTAKDETLDEDLISPIAGPLFAVFALLGAGIIALIIRYASFPGDREVLQVVGGWAIFNFVIVGAALQAVCEKQQRRGTPRVDLKDPAHVTLAGNPERRIPATITDASLTGMQIRLNAGRDVAPGQVVEGAPLFAMPVMEDAPSLSHPIKAQIKWVARSGKDITLGVEYVEDQPAIVAETIGQMIFGKSSRWEARREYYFHEKGLLGGLFYIVQLFIRGVWRTFLAALKEPARRKRARQRALDQQVIEEPPVHEQAFSGYADPVVTQVAFRNAGLSERPIRMQPTGTDRFSEPAE